MDALFEIEEIGRPAPPHAGLPDSCELCGHCLFLRLAARKRQEAAANLSPDEPAKKPGPAR